MTLQAPQAPAAPFAALMARANGVAHARLSDTIGLLDGVPVAGIFDDGRLEFEGIATGTPSIFLPSAMVASVVLGVSQFVKGDLISGTVYTVVDSEPDGEGWTLLQLRKGKGR